MNRPLSVGLGGDGDEYNAIAAIENYFCVSLNYQDAEHWTTVGDIWQSLQSSGKIAKNNSDAWDKFRCILCDETGVDWRKIERDSPLLGYPLSEQIKYYWKRITNHA